MIELLVVGQTNPTKVLAVEFDTWWNSEFHDPTEPNDNHTAVRTCFDQSGCTLAVNPNIPNLSDGNPHTARIVYQSQTVDVYLDDPMTPALGVPVDLGSVVDLDGGMARVGLHAFTGSAYENHDILSWSFHGL